MRFFSNDARESTDEQSADEQSADEQAKEQAKDERPDRVQSDPVAVPTQRPGSPWSDTPPTADADTTPVRDDADPAPFHEPGAQPTAFGASTVGGAVAASATANPADDRWDATDRDSAADRGVGDDATVAPGDGVATSSTTTYAGDTADRTPDTVPATWTEGDTSEARDRTESDDVVDVPLDDRDSAGTDADSARSDDPGTDRVTTDTDGDTNPDDSVTTDDDPDRTKTDALKDDGGFDDPKVADSPADSAVDSPADSAVGSAAVDSTVDDDHTGTTTDTDAGPLKDDGGFDDPKAVDPVTETTLDTDHTPDDSSAESTPPAVVAAPVAAAPVAAAAVTAGPGDTLFDQDDARSFQERWRDVQLRFVDSPKEAATDAAGLVDEAVEKLSAGLRAQREGLHNDTEDTEQLRVQLRGYREILNRILSL